MSEDTNGSALATLITGGVVLLVLFSIAMVVIGEFIIAGVTLLSVAFAIYLRETMT